MNTKTAILVTAALLFSMIGVAWSQNSNTAGNSNTLSNSNATNRARGGRGRDVGPANKNPYKPGPDTNFNAANGMVYHPEYANSANAWYPAGNSNIEYAANIMANSANYAVNADTANTAVPTRKKKTRRPAKRRVSAIPTVGNTFANILAAAFTR